MKIKFARESIGDNVCRAKVFGGWILQTETTYEGMYQMSTVFIPDPNHEWEIDR